MRGGWFLAALACVLTASPAGSAKEARLRHIAWPQDGILGTYDRTAVRRGFQVYSEVCSACHSMRLLSYRDLADLGYTDPEIEAIAGKARVTNGPNDKGEIFDRPGRPSDRFVLSFPSEKAARDANGGALPKDLSLIVKAREGGPDYVHALLTGYGSPPPGVTVGHDLYYNSAYPGQQIAMPPPLADGKVDFGKGPDGRPIDNSLDAEARDVVQFLSWASEPRLEERHRLGFDVMVFLGAFALVMYASKSGVWKKRT